MKQGEQTRGVPLAAATCAIWLRDLLVLARRAYQVITASDQWSRFVVLEIGGTLAISKLVPLAGLEPAQCCHYLILSQARLPIPPQGQAIYV